MVTIPHFALPLRYLNGAPVVNEQDSLDDIAACVEAIIRHPRGHRPEAPDFGVTDPTFSQGTVNIDLLRAEIAESEDRVDLALAQEPDLLDHLAHRVTVEVGG